MKRLKKRKGEKVLRPVHPNAGIEARYRRQMQTIIRQMADSFNYWLKASYRNNSPKIMATDSVDRMNWWHTFDNTDDPAVMWGGGNPDASDPALRVGNVPVKVVHLAMDATPASELQDAVDQLAKRWLKRFDQAAPKLAQHFAKAAFERSDKSLMSILKQGGFTVEFKMTPAMRDIFHATVEQNVQLIKSIPQQYLTDVQGAVMRSVQSGRDLGTLAKELEQKYGVTKRRAALIARDQNNKANSAMTRARQQEIGIKEAVWQHSGGGKEPRPTHKHNSGKRFNVAEGWFDPDPKVQRHIWPGELINCRCISKPVVKGFS